MFHHAPPHYTCPICLGVKGIENEDTLIRQSDIVYQDEFVTAFVASYFIGQNEGHLIVVPNVHYENMFELPDRVAAEIMKVAKHLSSVMLTAYQAQGVTTLQNNGPAASQHAFHYHLHLFPRYDNDDLYQYMNNKRLTSVEERLLFAQKIKAELTGSP
jgi:histidine triad (HIT) family protein